MLTKQHLPKGYTLTHRYNPEIHHRHSIRLQGYDYGQAGLYFITICTWHRKHIFGFIQDGEMRLSRLGKIARDEWFRTSELRPNIELAEFVVMPNHIHGIVAIQPSNQAALPHAPKEPPTEQLRESTQLSGQGTPSCAPTEISAEQLGQDIPQPSQAEAFGKPTSNTIPTIVRGYKAAVTKQINILRNCPKCPVWQRNYYEHIIRNEDAYFRIAAYILDNPRRWSEDSLRQVQVKQSQ
jgi:putative transposase